MSRPLFDLRCVCSRAPILAKYGTDERGKPFVWMKVHKQGRIQAEMVFTSGKVRMRCRECTRWNTVFIRDPDVVTARLEELPVEIGRSMLADASGG
jgi:hypothetical protein